MKKNISFQCKYNHTKILVDRGKNITLLNFVGFNGDDTVLVNLTDLKLLFEKMGLELKRKEK